MQRCTNAWKLYFNQLKKLILQYRKLSNISISLSFLYISRATRPSVITCINQHDIIDSEYTIFKNCICSICQSFHRQFVSVGFFLKVIQSQICSNLYVWREMYLTTVSKDRKKFI